MVLGVIVAVYGREPEDDKGKFHVEDYCFQELPKQPLLPELDGDRSVLNHFDKEEDKSWGILEELNCTWKPMIAFLFFNAVTSLCLKLA